MSLVGDLLLNTEHGLVYDKMFKITKKNQNMLHHGNKKWTVWHMIIKKSGSVGLR